MYIKVCKGNGGSIPFKIEEFKVPDFKLFNNDFDKDKLSQLLYDILLGKCPFQIIGKLSNKEFHYLDRFFNNLSNEAVNVWGTLQVVAPNEWVICLCNREIQCFNDYKKDVEFIYERVKNCEKCIKENN